MRLPRISPGAVAAAVLALVALAAGAWLLSTMGGEAARRGPVPLPSLGAELSFLDGGDLARRGPSTIVVVRFDRSVEFRPYHFRADGMGSARTVEEWAAALEAPLVFNAGQFDRGLDYLGWLKRDGKWLSSRRKTPWKGLLVSGPLGDVFWARIVDLDHADPAVVDSYQHVVQSMMLLDSKSRLRVRDSDLSACRTVLAEDSRGRILLVMTEGATTLGDLARWLDSSPLGIVRAMNLDGGLESQLALDTPELKLVLYGQYGTSSTVLAGSQVRYPIPAVVAVRPLAPKATPASPER